ncbi:MerR family transcriptional regulator [Geobacillus stearothermophilus]|nr:MerR family transcriptional regulator [Geobacillus stearothermophilus]
MLDQVYLAPRVNITIIPKNMYLAHNIPPSLYLLRQKEEFSYIVFSSNSDIDQVTRFYHGFRYFISCNMISSVSIHSQRQSDPPSFKQFPLEPPVALGCMIRERLAKERRRTTVMETYSIGEIAKKTGVSIRTLRYYDEIGLLQPTKDPSSGHRIYTEEDILQLHKIMSLKFIGLSLEEIRQYIHQPTYDLTLKETLMLEKNMLEQKRRQLERSIQAIEYAITLLEEEGEIDSLLLMSLIRSIQTEDDQKRLMTHYLDQETVDAIFHNEELKQKENEMIKSYAQFVKQVHELYGLPADHPDVQHMIETFLRSTFGLLSLETVEKITELLNQNQWDSFEWKEEWDVLSPLPFSKEETQWLEQAMDDYMQRLEHMGIDMKESKEGENSGYEK